MKAMLEWLRDADPNTYQRAFGWLKNVAWILIQDAPEKYFLDDGPYERRSPGRCAPDGISGRY